jgi:hypothetical protein
MSSQLRNLTIALVICSGLAAIPVQAHLSTVEGSESAGDELRQRVWQVLQHRSLARLSGLQSLSKKRKPEQTLNKEA